MILLDTHVLLWMTSGDVRLGPRTRRTLETALLEGEAAVSAVSFWEIVMLIRKGRLRLALDLETWRRGMLADGLVEVPVDGAIAARAGSLTDMHGDPVDRLIVATALSGHRLVTADHAILDWPGDLDRTNPSE